MKHLKMYEKFTDKNFSNLKEGDIVVCIDKNKVPKIDGIKYGRKYKINTINLWLLSLKRMNNSFVKDNGTGKLKQFFINNFMSEEDFEIWSATKKYNL